MDTTPLRISMLSPGSPITRFSRSKVCPSVRHLNSTTSPVSGALPKAKAYVSIRTTSPIFTVGSIEPDGMTYLMSFFGAAPTGAWPPDPARCPPSHTRGAPTATVSATAIAARPARFLLRRLRPRRTTPSRSPVKAGASAGVRVRTARAWSSSCIDHSHPGPERFPGPRQVGPNRARVAPHRGGDLLRREVGPVAKHHRLLLAEGQGPHGPPHVDGVVHVPFVRGGLEVGSFGAGGSAWPRSARCSSPIRPPR